MKRKKLSFIAFLLIQNPFALAGEATIVGTSENGQQTSMQLEYLGSDRLRVNVPMQADGYLLVLGSNAYSVSSQNGQSFVMNLSDLPNLGVAPPAPARVEGVQELSKTGRSETVAGINGEVWRMTYTDSSGNTHTDDMVLSSDPRARALSQAMNRMGQAMARGAGYQDSMAPHLGNKGVLRMGNFMKVASITAQDPPATRFDLPAQPTAMPDLGAVGNRLGAALGSLLSDKAKRQVDRQQEHAEQRADYETDRTMDEKVGGFLDKLFGK